MFVAFRKKLLLVFSFLIIGVVFYISTPLIYSCLSKTHRVNANILLVEGWVPEKIIGSAYNEYKSGNYDKIVTTGLNAPDFFPMVMNGYLVYTLKGISFSPDSSRKHSISVCAYGQLGGIHCSHFNFYVNDSLVKDFYADQEINDYAIDYTGKLKDIDSIMIQFDNDSIGDFGDHNLFVKEIVIDNKYHISYKNHSVYNRTAAGWEKRFNNNYSTYAEMARNTLLQLGVDSSRVICVPCTHPMENKTLSGALEFRKWMAATKIKVEGINVVSVGQHARRTWLTYKKVLRKHCPVGIISFQPHEAYYTGNRRWLTMKEIVGNIYYWIILMRY